MMLSILAFVILLIVYSCGAITLAVGLASALTHKSDEVGFFFFLVLTLILEYGAAYYFIEHFLTPARTSGAFL